MRTVLRFLLAALVVGATPARANVFDQFGFEPRGQAMGGAQVASGDNHVASYFNPSLLVLQKDVSFGLGVNWVQPVMDVHALSLSDSAKLQAAQPPDFSGLTLGVLFPLGGKVRNRLALGLGLYLPTNNLLRTEAIDPNTPSWYFYQSSPDRIVVALGAGIRVFDWLQIGGGAQVLGALIGGFDFRVNMFNNEFERRALRNDLMIRAAPLAGLTLNFEKLGLRIAAGYRAALHMNYSMPTTFDIVDVATVTMVMEGIVHYSPHTFTAGVQYSWGPLVASAELRYALWSEAPDPTVRVSFVADSDALDALGADGKFDAISPDTPPGLVDTLEPHVGLEYWIIPRFAVRVGYSFRPTPVPLQNGDHNLLDSDTHSFSVGLGLNFVEPLEIFSKPVHIDLVYQGLVLVDRVAEKASGGPVPSYSYGGKVHQVAAAVRYIF